MTVMYSIFFGAAAAAIAYSWMGKRIGYGNSANIWTMVGVVFVLVSILFYTVLAFLVNPS